LLEFIRNIVESVLRHICKTTFLEFAEKIMVISSDHVPHL
jgi:hypothetical protein